MPITDNLVLRVQRQTGDSAVTNIQTSDSFAGTGAATAITNGSDLGWRITGRLEAPWSGRSSINATSPGQGFTVALRYKINSNGDSGDFDHFFQIAKDASVGANLLGRFGSTQNRARYAGTVGTASFANPSAVKTIVHKVYIGDGGLDYNKVWVEGEAHTGTDPDYQSGGDNFASQSAITRIELGLPGTGELDVYDVAIWDRELTDQECLDVCEGIRTQLPIGASTTPVAFTGTVPTQNLTQNSAMSALDLSTYFSGSETPFTYAVHAGTLPTGLSLDTSTGIISGTPTGTGTASIVVRATDSAAGTADTNSFDIVVASATATVTVTDPLKNNTGTVLASETGIAAAVLDATTLASVHEATGLTTNGSGVLSAISDVAITAGNSYHVAIKTSSGGVGITGPITAS